MMKKLLVTMCVAVAMLATADAQDVSGAYAGDLTIVITMSEEAYEPVVSTDTIYLEDPEADGLYDMSIKNFSFETLTLGDLLIEDVASAVADGVVTLTKEGTVAGPTVGGQIPTTITLGETTVTDDKLALALSVDVPMMTMTVAVSFEGTKVTDGGQSGIASLVADQAEITVWGNEMMVRGAAEYTIYNTAGVPVQQGVADGSIISLDNLGGGIYLVKAGNRIEKFIKK